MRAVHVATGAQVLVKSKQTESIPGVVPSVHGSGACFPSPDYLLERFLVLLDPPVGSRISHGQWIPERDEFFLGPIGSTDAGADAGPAAGTSVCSRRSLSQWQAPEGRPVGSNRASAYDVTRGEHSSS